MATHKYVLQDLLNIRKNREDQAATEWARQKERVSIAVHALERQRRELEDYKVQRAKREEELFNKVLKQLVRSRELEDLRFRVNALRDKENDYLARVIEAQEKVKSEQAKLEEDYQRYREMYRQREKLDEHKVLWKQQRAGDQEFAEERENEDFKNRAPLLAVEGE